MSSYRIPSIANTCSIFQLLTSTRKAMTASEIAKELELPRTSVFRILKTLEEEGMVVAMGKNYSVGHRLINLGLQMISHIPERQLCVPVLQELTHRTQESSHFAILSGTHALFIEVCDSPHALRVARRTGSLIDIHCSASGKVLLAHSSPQACEHLLNRIEFTPRTPNTHKSKESLLPELEQVRSQGFAIDDIEYHDNVRCISVPAYNSLGQVIGALGISSADSRFPKSRIPELAKQLKKASQQLSSQLGYQGKV
ncbi:IclR family transcriptional regulator [Verrucomicrobiaceae bacterium N1E253]|uniref:IclR family transcriptional regulator n=1 Tax=Oceaniferula marina TaxID=2748318 RepID=A0A851GLN3_9BACT|nr:IclR family transcriptional regulator [Oceaniferula marina]NWK55680.1 IclR family transcriptional regulator [Oceaniferula marina]